MTIVATLTITHSDDAEIKPGETYGLVLTPEQLIPIAEIPAGADTVGTGGASDQPPAAPAE